MLNPGSQINGLFGYGNEALVVDGGIRNFTITAIAIVTPSSPSRQLPFIVPSQQKGRESKRLTIPQGAYIHQVGVMMPKELLFVNPANSGSVQIGTAFNNAQNVRLFTDPTVGLAPGQVPTLDATEVYTKIPGTPYGNLTTSSGIANPSSPFALPYVSVFPFEGIQANCPILANIGVPQPAAPGNLVQAAWTPSLFVDPLVAAPTSRNNKKTAFIVTISGQYIDASMPDAQDVFTGMYELE